MSRRLQNFSEEAFRFDSGSYVDIKADMEVLRGVVVADQSQSALLLVHELFALNRNG